MCLFVFHVCMWLACMLEGITIISNERNIQIIFIYAKD